MQTLLTQTSQARLRIDLLRRFINPKITLKPEEIETRASAGHPDLFERACLILGTH